MDLKEIQEPVKPLLKATNAILKEKAKSNIHLLSQMRDLTPMAKGKKIRSTLLFLLAGMNRVPPDGLAEIASAVEMFHLSSLIHDDIMDNSRQRRGQETLNTNMGNFRSVLWGDYLFIGAFTALQDLGKPFLLDIVLKAARLMVEGQILEVQNAYCFDTTYETYYDIIMRKTASLFAAVSQIVTVLGGDSQQRMEDFYRFGLDFGIIFQISDDMLDIFSAKTGKDRFRDLEEGKITLPFILLIEKSNTDIKEDYMKGNRRELLELFEKYRIKERCMEKINDYHRRCVDFLNDFPASIYRDSLFTLLDFIKYRDY